MASWQKVDPDTPVSEGDKLRTYHCIQAPDVPFNDLLARLSVEYSKLTNQINSNLPDCAEVEVIETELRESSGVVVEGDECEFMYVTTYRVTKLEDDCEPVTASAVGQALVIALAALIVLAGVSMTLYQAEKFLEAPGGGETAANVSTAALLVAGAWAFQQFAGEGDGEGLI